jgi:hypothetical protein
MTTEIINTIIAPMEKALTAHYTHMYVTTEKIMGNPWDMDGYGGLKQIVQDAVVAHLATVSETGKTLFKAALMAEQQTINTILYSYGETKRARVNGEWVRVPIAPTDLTYPELLARQESIRVAINGLSK